MLFCSVETWLDYTNFKAIKGLAQTSHENALEQLSKLRGVLGKFVLQLDVPPIRHLISILALSWLNTHILTGKPLFVVEFPTNFLKKVNLGASLLAAENLVPPELFA
jgi:hypothetical protein